MVVALFDGILDPGADSSGVDPAADPPGAKTVLKIGPHGGQASTTRRPQDLPWTRCILRPIRGIYHENLPQNLSPESFPAPRIRPFISTPGIRA